MVMSFELIQHAKFNVHGQCISDINSEFILRNRYDCMNHCDRNAGIVRVLSKKFHSVIEKVIKVLKILIFLYKAYPFYAWESKTKENT